MDSMRVSGNLDESLDMLTLQAETTQQINHCFEARNIFLSECNLMFEMK